MIESDAKQSVTVNGDIVSLEDIIQVAKGQTDVHISRSPAFVQRLETSQNMLVQNLEAGVPVYGVTTGFGKSCGKRLAMDNALINGRNLLRFHGCGTGAPLGIAETRAALMTRILCLARGYSGASIELLDQMAAFLNHGLTPVVPAEGSVGASGDLTPMSYVAAALAGEREVFYKGRRLPAAEALTLAGLKPYVFGPKEPLAMINGTSTMTGIATVVMDRARSIEQAAIGASALCIHALKGNSHHYDPVIGQAKPHPGQITVATRLMRFLETNGNASDLNCDDAHSLQDPYSVRCSPQVIGVLSDALKWMQPWVETEANSANDNPIFDPGTGRVLMGGNFYGGHIAFAMDALKAALASVADMCDRQVALMVDPHLNRGLPADLVRLSDEERLFNNGFKAMSIASSALAAEALKTTMPAASFSRSTESHNQDKVSMGTIAARDAARVCELAERTLAIHLLAGVQACEIRGTAAARPRIAAMMDAVRHLAPPLEQDRPMDADIDKLAQAVAQRSLPAVFANRDE